MTRAQSPLIYFAKEYERKIDAGKVAWEEGSFAFFFLPSLDAPRRNLILA